MKEIHIAQIITEKRREKGLTQEELASYFGVSKASVSKWETGQSYPDITFLPQLAAYFGISIDTLMGYVPQMEKEDIRKLYLRLSADFMEKPFMEVLEHCREIGKKYFSCFPLLFQLGALMVNNSMAGGDTALCFSVIAEAKKLFIRVKEESEDTELRQLSLSMEAFCALTLGNPDEVITLLEGTSQKIICMETLLGQAYQMTGRHDRAKAALQVGMYQHCCSLVSVLSEYMLLCTQEAELFEESYKRALAVAEAFDMKNLHPSIRIKVLLIAAQGYATLGNTEKALAILEEYTDLVTGDIYPLQLKGDSFFDQISQWLEELDLGTSLPRDERIIRQSMVAGVVENPMLATLTGEYRFQRIVERLKSSCNGEYPIGGTL